MSLVSQLDALASPRILVLGDLILDRYTFGNAERVSPEAPVLILRSDNHDVRLGGAASVALLLRALGADVTLSGVIGNDSAGRMLQALVHDAGIDGRLIGIDPGRPTTTKERFVGRTGNRSAGSGSQLLRVDSESRQPIDDALEADLLSAVLSRLAEFDAILISDYAKGICTPRLLQTLIGQARAQGMPVLIDPARNADYSRYRCATLVKPNRVEAELASGCRITTPQDALHAAHRVCGRYEFEATLVTLDSEGMALVRDDDSHELFSTEPRQVCDVTGAGDMVLATLGLCLAQSEITAYLLPDAVRVANVAAGLQVERLGVAPITRAELRTALERVDAKSNGSESDVSGQMPVVETCQKASFTTDNCQLATDKIEPGGRAEKPLLRARKLTTLTEMIELAAEYRLAGKTTVFTNGCFDLLHLGHIQCLEEAAELGEVLIVAVNSDASVRRIKGRSAARVDRRQLSVVSGQFSIASSHEGRSASVTTENGQLTTDESTTDHRQLTTDKPIQHSEIRTPNSPSRPIIPEQQRAALLAALAYVDHVLIFDDDAPHRLLEQIRPDVLVKGGTTADIAGREIVESYGGRVCRVGAVPAISTTQVIAAVRAR